MAESERNEHAAIDGARETDPAENQSIVQPEPTEEDEAESKVEEPMEVEEIAESDKTPGMDVEDEERQTEEDEGKEEAPELSPRIAESQEPSQVETSLSKPQDAITVTITAPQTPRPDKGKEKETDEVLGKRKRDETVTGGIVYDVDDAEDNVAQSASGPDSQQALLHKVHKKAALTIANLASESVNDEVFRLYQPAFTQIVLQNNSISNIIMNILLNTQPAYTID